MEWNKLEKVDTTATPTVNQFFFFSVHPFQQSILSLDILTKWMECILEFVITYLLHIFGIKLCAEESSFSTLVVFLFSVKMKKKTNLDTPQTYLKGGKY